MSFNKDARAQPGLNIPVPFTGDPGTVAFSQIISLHTHPDSLRFRLDVVGGALITFTQFPGVSPFYRCSEPF